jgi:malonyl-CoA decarboxylase
MLGGKATERLSWAGRIWSTVSERGRDLIRLPASHVPPLERTCRLAEALVSERGEASGAALARELQHAHAALGAADRLAFLTFVAGHFSPDEARLVAAAKAYLENPGSQLAMELTAAAEPPRQELLRRMNMAPGGTAALIGIREELLAVLKEQPTLKPLESDLRHLFSSWFNRGFLELRRIDWNTPAVILEKLIAHEAVHEIQGWDDLRRRLGPDRRCFAFFHPTLPGELLIFVEVALVKGLAAAIHPLLERHEIESGGTESGAGAPDTAIFYSISNCQEGLRGISFGNFLIKQVVEELKLELPSLKHFATLSPVPGFANWLEKQFDREGVETAPLLHPNEEQALLAAVTMTEPGAALKAILQQEGWWTEPAFISVLRPLLTRLCAVYLTAPRDGKGPSDPVARFHLGNGASLERINWLGNTAAKGIGESYGIMVNYLYDPDLIEINHERFVKKGVVARSAEVEALLHQAPAANTAAKPAAVHAIANIVARRQKPKLAPDAAAG